MENYLAILKEAIPGTRLEDLQLSLSEHGVQSLDAIILRATLESHYGFEIPDHDWQAFGNVTETLEYCDRVKREREIAESRPRITTSRAHEITMPKMANKALSESWLMKEMGDMHWELLTKGLEQKSSDFTDSMGNRLYAAFVRMRYSIDALNTFGENEALHLEGEISRAGNYSYFSDVKGACNGKYINAQLMTSFSARKGNDNSTIAKSSPDERINHIPELKETPDFYNQHRLVKKNMTTQVVTGGYTFDITDAALETIDYTLNPYYEINGVGLVYFAVYPVIADRCASDFFRNTMKMQDYDREYHTIFRDTFYFANCNADDTILVTLNSAEQVDSNTIKMTASMHRKSDNKLMARILTVKQKNA